jgi:3-oxoacyl-[acyl-carrier-protein] synthase III
VTGIRITGWGIALPDKVVTNDDLAASLDTSDAWITERTGIRERHLGGTTSGLAIEAAKNALRCAGRTGADIAHVVLAPPRPTASSRGRRRPSRTRSGSGAGPSTSTRRAQASSTAS